MERYQVKGHKGNLIISLLLAVVFCAIPVLGESFFVEAETGALTNPMTIGQDAAASGGAYISVPSDSGPFTAPNAEGILKINLSKDGEVYIWVNIFAPSGDGDAIKIRFGTEAPWRIYNPNKIWSQYVWLPTSIYGEGVSGENTITIFGPEVGARIDRLFVTDNPTEEPDNPVAIKNFGQSASAGILNIQNYPNPFTRFTFIRFQGLESGKHSVSIHTLAGKLIKQLNLKSQAKNQYKAQWDGLNQFRQPVANGVYIVKIKTDKRVSRQTVSVIR